MTDRKDGGSAFPVHETVATGGIVLSESGMSLRDYFAAKAMAEDIVQAIHEIDFAWVAARAYKMADAMLKEREA